MNKNYSLKHLLVKNFNNINTMQIIIFFKLIHILKITYIIKITIYHKTFQDLPVLLKKI